MPPHSLAHPLDDTAIVVTDAQGLIISTNKTGERLFQQSLGELREKNFQQLCTIGTKSLPMDVIFRSMVEGRIVADQTIFILGNIQKNQNVVTASFCSLPTTGTTPDNKVIICLQRSNAPLPIHQLALNIVADCVLTVDEKWTITTFNQAAERLTGWTQEEVIGKKYADFFQTSLCGTTCLLTRATTKKTSLLEGSTVIRRKDGSPIPIFINAAPLYCPNGTFLGGIETFRDKSDLLRNELILESIADGVFTVNRHWQITSFNRAAEDITGWKSVDAIGKSCSSVFCSSICGENCAIAESLYSGSPMTNRSITIQNKRGDKVPVSISAAPLTDHEGNIIGGVETFRDLTAINTLRRQLNQQFTFDEIISRSMTMQRLFKIMPEIARSPSTVLILGESGTGKELFARALFNARQRKDKPFLTVNCGALPEALLESELFGYKAGAFTDARIDRPGRFSAAEGGTLFLDEIGDIPQSIQVKLLRVLQEKTYEPLGSNSPCKADVRIITATNRDLSAMVKDGLFREDLFYRLNVVKIQLPPLRQRKEDLPLLIEHFIRKFSVQLGKDIVGISPSALAILMHYNFPGNIRELENIIEYSFILCESGFIQAEHLPDPFAPLTEGTASHKDHVNSPGNPESLAEIEKQAIFLALEKNNWKRMATCRQLGISKDTLRRKIKKYGFLD